MLPTDDPENPDGRRRSSEDPIRVWLVECPRNDEGRRDGPRTYATRDGAQTFELEPDGPADVPHELEVDASTLSPVTDPERRRRLAAAVKRRTVGDRPGDGP